MKSGVQSNTSPPQNKFSVYPNANTTQWNSFIWHVTVSNILKEIIIFIYSSNRLLNSQVSRQKSIDSDWNKLAWTLTNTVNNPTIVDFEWKFISIDIFVNNLDKVWRKVRWRRPKWPAKTSFKDVRVVMSDVYVSHDTKWWLLLRFPPVQNQWVSLIKQILKTIKSFSVNHTCAKLSLEPSLLANSARRIPIAPLPELSHVGNHARVLYVSCSCKRHLAGHHHCGHSKLPKIWKTTIQSRGSTHPGEIFHSFFRTIETGLHTGAKSMISIGNNY